LNDRGPSAGAEARCMAPLLELREVGRLFGGLRAAWGVSFAVERGSVLGLVGPNGAGKTTLFDCITGFHPPSAGEVRFDGARIDGQRPEEIGRRGITRAWQKVRPLPELSALDNVVAGALLRTSEAAQARFLAREALGLVGLSHREATRAGALPIGERKRLEVARVLAGGARLLLLDEPLAGLCAEEGEVLIALILRLRERGLTQLVIEHDLRAVERIACRVVALAAGVKVAEGAPQEVLRHPLVLEAWRADGARAGAA
jgi:branched-chain amino acid transport system ATP-binding protein